MIERYQKALFSTGLLILIAAIIHGAWHWFLPNYPTTQEIHPAVLSTMQLMNAAITLTLLIMGVTAVIASKSTTLTLPQTQVVTGLLLAFWLIRLILEFVMPLELPLLFIESPQTITKIIIAMPVVLLSMPFFSKANTKNQHPS